MTSTSVTAWVRTDAVATPTSNGARQKVVKITKATLRTLRDLGDYEKAGNREASLTLLMKCTAKERKEFRAITELASLFENYDFNMQHGVWFLF